MPHSIKYTFGQQLSMWSLMVHWFKVMPIYYIKDLLKWMLNNLYTYSYQACIELKNVVTIDGSLI